MLPPGHADRPRSRRRDREDPLPGGCANPPWGWTNGNGNPGFGNSGCKHATRNRRARARFRGSHLRLPGLQSLAAANGRVEHGSVREDPTSTTTIVPGVHAPWDRQRADKSSSYVACCDDLEKESCRVWFSCPIPARPFQRASLGGVTPPALPPSTWIAQLVEPLAEAVLAAHLRRVIAHFLILDHPELLVLRNLPKLQSRSTRTPMRTPYRQCYRFSIEFTSKELDAFAGPKKPASSTDLDRTCAKRVEEHSNTQRTPYDPLDDGL